MISMISSVSGYARQDGIEEEEEEEVEMTSTSVFHNEIYFTSWIIVPNENEMTHLLS